MVSARREWTQEAASRIRLWYVTTFSRQVPELDEVKEFTLRVYPKYVRKEDNVLEIGARVGASTRVLSQLARHVDAFEPDRRNFRMLKSYVRPLGNVSVFNLAIGNADGTVALKVSDNDFFSGVSSLYGVKGKKYVKSYEVGLRRLDSLKLSNPPSVLVMDCEGAELDVLEGGKKTLASIPTVLAQPHVLSDGTNTGPELKDRLKALGFENIEEFTPTSQNSWTIALR